MALKNVLFLVFFSQSAKTSNLWALLTRGENVLCVVIVIPNIHVKDHFN